MKLKKIYRCISYLIIGSSLTSSLVIPQAGAAQRVIVDPLLANNLAMNHQKRVPAGVYFSVKLTSKAGKISGECWHPFGRPNGFEYPTTIRMKSGKATLRLVSTIPGNHVIEIYCGGTTDSPLIGGRSAIYISP